VRITDALTFDMATRSSAAAREAFVEAQQQASTGSRVVHPGDDPAAAGLIAAHRLASARFAAVSQAAGLASDELTAADGALDGVSTALSRARELAVQFSSSGYPQAQSAMGAEEVKTLADQIVSNLNSRFGNRYIFGGAKDAAPPFDRATGAYAGDAGVRQVEIAPGVLQQSNVRADLAITPPAGSGENVLQALQALQTALQANDLPGIQGSLDKLDAGISQVAAARSQVGASMHALDVAVTAGKAASQEVEAAGAKLGEVDLVTAAIRLAETQNALQASLAATAQGFKLSLLNYL
jgi:flagellar hook-associated protein 3 FlgL